MRKEKEKILINFDASKFGSTIRNEEIVHHEVDAGYEDMGVSAKKETTKRYASEQTAIPINFESKPFQSILPENIGQIEAKLADSSFISDIDVTDNKIEPTILSRKNSQKLDTQFEKNADNDHEMNDVSPIKHTDQTQDQLIKHSEKNETKVDEDKKEKSEVSHNKANFE